jgi:hypothetical protein
VIRTRVIEEARVPGKPLGRHIGHDHRNLSYPFKGATALRSVRHSKVPDGILDQGSVGSCTGNSTVGALKCSAGPLYAALSAAQKRTLNESLAVKVYTRATQTDSIPGAYPTQDTGSDGPDAAKAAVEFGYLKGYLHALSLNDALAALVSGPVIVGVDWYEGFDDPSLSGQMSLAGSIRGGHELCVDELDVANQLVWVRNSWGTSWGLEGRACWSWDVFGKLLASDGDCTVLLPLSAPAPTPVPVSDPDRMLASGVHDWVQEHKHYSDNERVRQLLLAWESAKGLG